MSLKTRYNLGIGLGLLLLIFGYLLLVLHWPNAAVVAIIAYAIIGGTYPRYVIRYKERSLINIFKGSGILFWSAFNICNIYFYKSHNSWLRGLALVALLFWLLAVVYGYLFPNDVQQSKTTRLINSAFIVGGGLLGIATLFKFIHWPYASILFMIGSILFGGSLFVILFGIQEED